jgi:hypothetical protein
MKTLLLGAAALAASVCVTEVRAQPPVQDVSPYRHGNLAEAQSLIAQAFDRLSDAQNANNHDLGGHVGRAKQLLRQANVQIKIAAQYANRR